MQGWRHALTNRPQPRRCTTLHPQAAEAGSLKDVDAHLHSDLSFVYWSTFSGGNTIWHKAAKAGRLGVLKSMAAIVAAAYEAPKGTGEAQQLHLLLKVGATPKEALRRLVNMFNFKRVTPLMLAAGRGHTEVVEWLLQQGERARFSLWGGWQLYRMQ